MTNKSKKAFAVLEDMIKKEKSLLNKFIVADMVAIIKTENEELKAALSELVSLKILKDARVYTSDYLKRKPLAWDTAIKLIKKLNDFKTGKTNGRPDCPWSKKNKLKKYLDKVAYKAKSNIKDDEGRVYLSKFDNSYVTTVGMESNIKFLMERGITEELTHGVGFSPSHNKWYGWSHRAIFGFEIGSTCKKGDCHYKGRNIKELEEDAIKFWEDETHLNVHSDGIVSENNERYFDIKWKYDNKVPNKKLRNTIGGCLHYIKDFGRGEWTAKTMEDAKQMAIDFNEGVS